MTTVTPIMEPTVRLITNPAMNSEELVEFLLDETLPSGVVVAKPEYSKV